MDIIIDDVVFEESNKEFIPPTIPEQMATDRARILIQLLHSDYYEDGLNIDRFLEEDLAVDLDKLYLAISVLVEYLEFSVKIGNPIYVFLRGIDKYMEHRHLSVENPDRLVEETNFFLNFCQSVANEESSREVVVLYEPKKE